MMRAMAFVCVVTPLVFLLLSAVTAAAGTALPVVRVSCGSAADWDRCTRDQYVQVPAGEAGGARLARSWLVATEQGVTSKHPQELSATCWVRKSFPITLPQVQGADLWIFSGGGSMARPMMIRVNGHALTHTAPNVRKSQGWQRERIPAAYLRTGTNEVILGGSGQVRLDIYSPNAGSAITYDAGKSWHPVEGEYIVRLRVLGYAPRGVVTSEAIDTGRQLATGRGIGPWPRAARAVLAANADVPAGTALAYQWRTGDTRAFQPDRWTPWQDGASAAAPRRFFQWRAILTTRRGDRTPLLRAVGVSLEPSAAAVPALPAGIHVVRDDEPADLPGSHPFTYETDTPRIRYLRDKYELAKILPAEGADLARTTAVRAWVSHRWNNGWDWGKYQYVPPWDALILLEMAPLNYSLGMCTHFATTYVQTSSALGFISRHLIVDNHCLAESYLDDAGRWIIQDPGPGPGPDGYPIGLIYTANGQPLNALEMHRLLASGASPVQAVPRTGDGDPWPYTPEHNLWLYTRFGIPLRNNHLSVPWPAEEEHGQDHYHYDGYLWWTDNLDEPQENVSCYSLLSNRPADFYPGVNSTWIDPEMTSDRVARVTLSHDMPNWKTFEVQIDGGAWAPVSARLDWTLHAGRNTLSARSRNLFGIAGRPTVMEIDRSEG